MAVGFLLAPSDFLPALLGAERGGSLHLAEFHTHVEAHESILLGQDLPRRAGRLPHRGSAMIT